MAEKGELKTVTGKITAVGKPNNWGYANIKVENGQGDVWMSTKVPGLIGAAREAKGTTRIIEYRQTRRPKEDGVGFFENNYLEKIGAIVNEFSDDDIPFGEETLTIPDHIAEAQAAGLTRIEITPTTIPTDRAINPSPDRDTQIHRQSAGKVIAEMLGPDSVDITTQTGWHTFTTMCNKFVEYVRTGQ